MKARSRAPCARAPRANSASCSALRSSAATSSRTSAPLERTNAANCLPMALSNGPNLRTAMRIGVLMHLPLPFQTCLQRDRLRTGAQPRQHRLEARSALLLQRCDRECRLDRRLRRADGHTDIQGAREPFPFGALIPARADPREALEECRTRGWLFTLPFTVARENFL